MKESRHKLRVSPETFLKRLAEYVDTQHTFQSHFSTKIEKPYFGKIEGSTFVIKNTPIKQRDATIRVVGSIEDNELHYRIGLHNNLFLLFLLIPFAAISLFFLFYQFYFGLVTLGILFLTILMSYLSFQKEVRQFARLIESLNTNQDSAASPIPTTVMHREDFSSCTRKPPLEN